MHARDLFGEQKQAPYQHLRPGAFVEAFDELAARADDAFRYPVCYLKPKA
mgnify:CR=1 FL=1